MCHEFGRFGRGRSEQQIDPGLVLDQDLTDEFEVERSGSRELHDALAVEA